MIIALLFSTCLPCQAQQGSAIEEESKTDTGLPKQEAGYRRNGPPPTEVNGTVLDITGHLVAVLARADRTIWVTYVPGDLPPDLVVGKTVRLSGTFEKGFMHANLINVVGGTAWPTPTTPRQRSGRIDHILFLIQENHSFDNYFGTYPGADGFPEGIKVPLEPGGEPVIAPFHFTFELSHDLPHRWKTAHAAIDNGKNHGWITAERSLDTMGYYDRTDIPNYWAYADHFTLCDHFFSSLAGPSLPITSMLWQRSQVEFSIITSHLKGGSTSRPWPSFWVRPT